MTISAFPIINADPIAPGTGVESEGVTSLDKRDGYTGHLGVGFPCQV